MLQMTEYYDQMRTQQRMAAQWIKGRFGNETVRCASDELITTTEAHLYFQALPR
jgi:hypothetical protein